MKSRSALLTVVVVILCGTRVIAVDPAQQERVGFSPRSSDSQIKTSAFLLPGNDVTGEGKMNLIGGGIRITVGQIGEGLEMSADRAVILGTRQRDGVDVYDTEIYLEGNVVFGNGQDRVIANRLYYDVTDRVRIVTDSDIIEKVGNVQDVSDAEAIRTAIHEIASRSPDKPKKCDLQVGDKVALTFTGELVSLLKPRPARLVALQPSEIVHVQVVGTVVKIQPNGNLLVESASTPITLGKRSCIQTISGEIHPSRMRSRNIRGDDLESLKIVLKEREDPRGKTDAK